MSTVDIGGVVITTGLVWADKHTYSPVAQNQRRTLGGTAVVEWGALSAGAPVTLVALQDQGWVTLTQLQALQVLADVAGAVYSVTIGGDTFQAMFRHQDAPALEFSPLIPRTVPLAGDYFTGTIKLLTV